MKAKNYLDKERNIEESKKYKTYTEFRSGCKAAYYIASSNGWLSGYDWLVDNINKKMHTYEECEMESKKYSKREQFMKMAGGYYYAAKRNGWLDDFAWLDGKYIQPADRTIEMCKREAAKYRNRSEFKKMNRPLYRTSFNRGWLDDSWFDDYKECETVSKEYHSVHEFNLKAHDMYKMARRNKWLSRFTWLNDKYDEHTKTHRSVKGVWTFEDCKAEAAKYPSRVEYYRKSRRSYDAAKRNGWLSEFVFEVAPKTPGRKKKLTKDYVESVAKSCSTLKEFRKKSMGAYIAACKNGWLSDYTWLKRAKNSPKGNKFEEALEKLNSEMVEICPEKPKTFYRDKDIMQMLQVSKSTLKKYIKGGYIGYTVVCGKRYYRESDLEEFLFKNHVPAFAYEKGKTNL